MLWESESSLNTCLALLSTRAVGILVWKKDMVHPPLHGLLEAQQHHQTHTYSLWNPLYIAPQLTHIVLCRFFSILDLLRCPMKNNTKQPSPAICIYTTEGLFQFHVMPFVFCSAPATLMVVMDLVLAGFQWGECVVYIYTSVASLSYVQ